MNPLFVIGKSASLSKTISKEDIEKFAEMVGDKNPVHIDDDFAKKTRFGKRIAHGMLCASLISAIIGTKLPGPGTIYLSQSLTFVAPVFVGDTITGNVVILKMRTDKPIITLETNCVNQNGDIILKGEAIVTVDNNE